VKATTMTNRPTAAADVLSDLHRLIEALDRRVPHLERSAEPDIARDAADLRLRAERLIRRIEGDATGT
jgi:hypothetical protein